MAKTQTRESLMECVHSFTYDSPETGAPTTIPAGLRFRPDHEAVRVGSIFFVSDDTPDDERPGLTDFLTVEGTTTHKPRNRPSGWRSDLHSTNDWA
jgi:hypothetical protein